MLFFTLNVLVGDRDITGVDPLVEGSFPPTCFGGGGEIENVFRLPKNKKTKTINFAFMSFNFNCLTNITQELSFFLSSYQNKRAPIVRMGKFCLTDHFQLCLLQQRGEPY